MATLKVPAHVPAPSEDAEQLRKAFAGFFLFTFVFYIKILFYNFDLLMV